MAFSAQFHLDRTGLPGSEVPLVLHTAVDLDQPTELQLECAAGGTSVQLKVGTLRAVRVSELEVLTP